LEQPVVEWLSERVAVVPGGVNIGVLRGGGGRLILVDTGINETAAKKALRAAREEVGGEVAAIINTHGHADHFGGNQAVVKRTGARVYAPALDEAVIRHPILQPALLFGGADPPESMRGGFMLAKPSPVDEIVSPGSLIVEGIEIEVVPLFGHSPGQVGYVVDDVFFCADVVLPATVLEKYKIPYLFSLTDHLQALDVARAVRYRTAVPGHGPLVEDLTELLDLNQALINDVLTLVREITSEPVSSETVMAEVLAHYGHEAADAPSFYLLQPTILAFLTHLHRTGQVTHEIAGNRSLWTAANV
jgi:glyoxylase-like metal-dependent hydrolase (beta-lactamase superfamily II)